MGEDAAADDRFAGASVLLRRAELRQAAKSSSAPRIPILPPSLRPRDVAPGRSPTLWSPNPLRRPTAKAARDPYSATSRRPTGSYGGHPARFYFERPRPVDKTGRALAKEIALSATVILANATIEANGDHAPR